MIMQPDGVYSSNIECDEFEECSGKSLNNAGNGKLIANGFKSAWNDTTSIISNSASIHGDSSCREIGELSVGGNIWITGT